MAMKKKLISMLFMLLIPGAISAKEFIIERNQDIQSTVAEITENEPEEIVISILTGTPEQKNIWLNDILTGISDNAKKKIETLIIDPRSSISSPPDLTGLNNLTGLGLSGNQLSSAPNLTELSKLEILNLGENQLTSPPNLAGLNNLTTLHLGNNQLTYPPDLTGLSNLKLLNLENNQIFSPPDLTGLSNLRALNLSKNNLSASPNLTELSNLEALHLGDNQLTSPPSLTGLSNLQALQLDSNQLISSPNLTGLSNLKMISMSNNQLTLPPNFAGLKALEVIILSGNQLTSPPDLTGLHNLHKLDLRFNKLTVAPTVIPSVNVHLKGNPIGEIGTPEDLEFFVRTQVESLKITGYDPEDLIQETITKFIIKPAIKGGPTKLTSPVIYKEVVKNTINVLHKLKNPISIPLSNQIDRIVYEIPSIAVEYTKTKSDGSQEIVQDSPKTPVFVARNNLQKIMERQRYLQSRTDTHNAEKVLGIMFRPVNKSKNAYLTNIEVITNPDGIKTYRNLRNLSASWQHWKDSISLPKFLEILAQGDLLLSEPFTIEQDDARNFLNEIGIDAGSINTFITEHAQNGFIEAQQLIEFINQVGK